jgi:hypothetical protein
MKVKKLIELLKDCDENMDVCITSIELDYPTGTYDTESFTVEIFGKRCGLYIDNLGNECSGSFVSLRG